MRGEPGLVRSAIGSASSARSGRIARPALGVVACTASLLVLPPLVLLGGCGAATVGVIAGIFGKSSGSSSVPPGVTGFDVSDSRVSPVSIKFTITGDRAVSVALLFRPSALSETGEERRGTIRSIVGGRSPGSVDEKTVGLENLRPGPHERIWDFANDIPANRRGSTYYRGAAIRLEVDGVENAQDERVVNLGNDAPVLDGSALVVRSDVEQTDDGVRELVGTITATFRLSDSSGDSVNIEADYAIEPIEGSPLQWRTATEAGTGGPVTALAEGGPVSFAWDSSADLTGRDRESFVRMRFRARETEAPELGSDDLESSRFKVDDNAEPVVALREGLIVASPDRRRGIPIPFTAGDADGDDALLVFQWAPLDDRISDLPAEPDELRKALDDPAERRRLRIMTERPVAAGGFTVPLGDPRTIRLPELSGSSAGIFAAGSLAGRRLELLRASSIPSPARWSDSPLTRPIAAIPAKDGVSADVLDAYGGDGFRIVRIDLAEGTETGSSIDLSSSGLTPATMARGRSPNELLVGGHRGDAWEVLVVDAAAGTFRTLASVAAGSAVTVTALATTGPATVIAALSDSLAAIRAPSGPLVVTTIAEGIDVPVGLAADPRDPRRVFVLDRGRDPARARIVALDLDSLSVVREVSLGAALENPAHLALEAPNRLLFAVSTPMGGSRLMSVQIEGAGAAETSLVAEYDRAIDFVATGGDGLRVLVSEADATLSVGGGVEQRRTIVACGGACAVGTDLRVEPPFHVPAGEEGLRPRQPWRISVENSLLKTSSESRRGTFVWDSERDVPSGGVVVFRVTPIDVEDLDRGARADSEAARSVVASLDPDPIVLRSTPVGNRFGSVAAGDVEADGDLDLVAVEPDANSIVVFCGNADGSISASDTVGEFGGVLGPSAVTLADFDADGDLDVATANVQSRNLTIFEQDAPCRFSATRTAILAHGLVGPNRPHVVARDLDEDGAPDVVASIEAGIAVFLTSDGLGSSPDFTLGEFPATTRPLALDVADLDVDGDLDIVSAGESVLTGESHIAIFLQRGFLQFRQNPDLRIGLSSIASPVSLTVGDLSGDGLPDIAFANKDGDNVSVFFQASPGGFDGASTVALGGRSTTRGPCSVALLDSNGDGLLDVACGNGASRITGEIGDDIRVFVQKRAGEFVPGDARFDSRSSFRLGGAGNTLTPEGIVAADFDHDGRSDLVSANREGPGLALFLHSTLPSRRGAPDVVLTGGGLLDAPAALAVADVNGDGLMDVVSANRDSDNVTIHVQDGPGILGTTPRVALGGSLIMDDPRAVAVADIDGDGRIDVLCADSTADFVSIFLQDAGGFRPAPDLTLGRHSVTDGPSGLAISDLDDDGRPDIAVALAADDVLAIFFQSSPGLFSREPNVRLSGSAGAAGVLSVAASDVDLDGRIDLVSANADAGTLSVFLQNSPGEFTVAPDLPVPASNPRPVAVSIADFDGDGLPDLLSSVATGGGSVGSVFLFRGSAGGALEPGAVVAAAGFVGDATGLAIGDVDRDNDLDLLASGTASDDVRLFLQSAAGRLVPTTLRLGSDSTIRGVSSIAIDDIDGDGDLDVLVAGGASDSIGVFFGAH